MNLIVLVAIKFNSTEVILVKIVTCIRLILGEKKILEQNFLVYFHFYVGLKVFVLITYSTLFYDNTHQMLV